MKSHTIPSFCKFPSTYYVVFYIYLIILIKISINTFLQFASCYHMNVWKTTFLHPSKGEEMPPSAQLTQVFLWYPVRLKRLYQQPSLTRPILWNYHLPQFICKSTLNMVYNMCKPMSHPNFLSTSRPRQIKALSTFLLSFPGKSTS